ncbi:hypothetical protein [Microvirga soli]|uniref:hypothetical protein n=1 Tax=Microvirga soli TaxID=1854496 RepID=UPI00191D8388|nr:hypothetical protein [Microvirga soli]
MVHFVLSYGPSHLPPPEVIDPLAAMRDTEAFWQALVDNLVLQGRHEEALQMFEPLLALRNDIGLLAEEYGPVGGRQVGNVPQAFSHLALANSARKLALGDKHAAHRS